MPEPPRAPLVCQPIGVVRTPFADKASAPRQPAAARGVEGRVVLDSTTGMEDALQDLERFTHVFVLYWFHLARGFRPRVLPPRSDRRRGVLATRAPHRPNPLGLSVVRLVRVDGLTLHVRDVDMVDGTPVLDVKPYLPYADAVTDAGHGWLEPAAADPSPPWAVTFDERARAALELLRAHGVDLEARLVERLALGPQPHAYRRIRRTGAGLEIGVGEWRARFDTAGREIRVRDIRSGYRARDLAAAGPDLAAHRELVARFGG